MIRLEYLEILTKPQFPYIVRFHIPLVNHYRSIEWSANIQGALFFNYSISKRNKLKDVVIHDHTPINRSFLKDWLHDKSYQLFWHNAIIDLCLSTKSDQLHFKLALEAYVVEHPGLG